MTSADTVERAVQGLSRCFRDAGFDSPEVDARILVAEGLGVTRTALFADPQRRLRIEEIDRIADYRRRRLAREPVSRILGRREFHGLVLEVEPATLDPRPDTETVVDAVLELVACGEIPRDPAVLDAGTGSGAILLAILASLPGTRGMGVDIDAAALAVASRNAARLGLAQRATLARSDWLCAVTGPFDVIVSNPPYIPSREIAGLAPEVVNYDPLLALDGGSDGLAAYRAILKDVRRVLRASGWIAVEVGSQQAAAVIDLFGRHGLEAGSSAPYVWEDLGGHTRCVAAKARW